MTQILQRDVLEMAGDHFVQFYDADSAALVANVAAFIDGGLNAGDSIVVYGNKGLKGGTYGEIGRAPYSPEGPTWIPNLATPMATATSTSSPRTS